MKKVTLVVMVAALSFCHAESWGQQGYDPAAIRTKADGLIQAARDAEAEGSDEAALKNYRKAAKYLLFLQKKMPDDNPDETRAQIRQYREKIASLEDKLYAIPQGYIRVWPGMTRKGARYSKAQLLERKVEKTGEESYSVDEITVDLVRVGSRVGAKCGCPDFTYRGLKENVPCKHIWAVALNQRLTGPKEGAE